MNISIMKICGCHARVLEGTEKSVTEIAYRNISREHQDEILSEYKVKTGS
jgi:hypothetical protein